MMRNFFVTLLLAGVSLNALAAPPLRFATAAVNPPFEFFNADNQLAGFDLELAKAICKRMQQQCVFMNNDFDRLLPSLKFGLYDVVISGLDVTKERQEEVDFTDPYYANAATLIASAGRFSHIEQLKGKRIGVGDKTTHQAWLTSTWPEMVAVSYDNYQNTLLDIRNNRIDAMLGDTPSMHEVLKSHPELSAVGEPIADRHFFGYGVAMAVRKGNDEMRLNLNGALQSLRKDGTLQQLQRHWFGKAALPPPSASSQ